MKKLMVVILGIMALVMVGCADHYPEYAKNQAKIGDKNAKLVAQYFASQGIRDQAMFSAMGEKANPTAMVLYGFMQNQQNAQVVATFKNTGLVAPTTSMDVWETFMGNTVPTVAKWGFGYLIASDLITGLSAGMSVGGDYVTNTNALDSGGGDLTFDNNFEFNKAEGDINSLTDSMNSY